NLWTQQGPQDVLCGLYYSVKAGHGGVVRITTPIFDQLETAIIEGVLNIEAIAPDVYIDLETEPATTQAILVIGNLFLATTDWERDPVVQALKRRAVGFFGAEIDKG